METTKQIALLMHSAHHRQVYDNFIADKIKPIELKELNQGINYIQTSLQNARNSLFNCQYLGKEHTMGFIGIAQQIDEMNRQLDIVSKLVNKKDGLINLENYPID